MGKCRFLSVSTKMLVSINLIWAQAHWAAEWIPTDTGRATAQVQSLVQPGSRGLQCRSGRPWRESKSGPAQGLARMLQNSLVSGESVAG